MSTLLFHPLLRQCRRIFLRRHAVSLLSGESGDDRHDRQQVLVSIDLFVLLKDCTPTSDRLSEVLDYEFLREVVRRHTEGRRIRLQETLCDALLRDVLRHALVAAAIVRTEKTGIGPDAESIGVEVIGFQRSAIPHEFFATDLAR